MEDCHYFPSGPQSHSQSHWSVQYRIILPGSTGTSVNNLPSGKWNVGNPWPLGCKSDALNITLPSQVYENRLIAFCTGVHNLSYTLNTAKSFHCCYGNRFCDIHAFFLQCRRLQYINHFPANVFLNVFGHHSHILSKLSENADNEQL